MNYYCGNCGAEFRNVLEADYTACPLCKHKGLVQKIPDFETPERYEARAWKPWPDNAPVWVRKNLSRSGVAWGNWGVAAFFIAKLKYFKAWDSQIICAQGPEAPPDDWRPE
jgi:DNA-directed RNA polymerase subunit RPC12/RpoP